MKTGAPAPSRRTPQDGDLLATPETRPASHQDQIINLFPYTYCHVIDTNTNITKLIVGPQNLRLTKNVKVVEGPAKMILIPPMSYAVIKNPVCIKADGTPELTSFGQVKVKLNDSEIRTQDKYPEYFPLYPGEKLDQIKEAVIALATQNIQIRVLREYTEGGKTVSLHNSP